MKSGPPPREKLPVTTNGTVLLHIDFVLTGVVMTFLGPMLPSLSARWSLNDTQSGSLIFAEFFSSMFGMLLSGISVQRLGYRKTLMVGLVLMPLGVALLSFGPWLWGLASICIFGIGYGMTTPAGNLRTAETNPSRSAAALSVINAVWGIGAMSSPFLVDLALRAHRPNWFLFGTAASLAMLLLGLMVTRFVPDTRTEAAQTGEREPSIWQIRILPLICILFFIYVGTETCFGNWVAMYARRIVPENHSLAIRMPSFFWGALLAGRALAPIALKFKRETVVASIGLSFALLGGIALVTARGAALIAVGSLLTGVGLASIYPISVSLLASWFGNASRRVSGAVFASGNIGGSLMPLMVGTVSTLAGSLRFGFFVPLVGVLFMLAFYASEQKKLKTFTAEGVTLQEPTPQR